MGGCFSSQQEHGRMLMQGPGEAHLIRYPVGRQRRQPGDAPVANSLCQTIRRFFRKYIFSRCCMGESENHQERIARFRDRFNQRVGHIDGELDRTLFTPPEAVNPEDDEPRASISENEEGALPRSMSF